MAQSLNKTQLAWAAWRLALDTSNKLQTASEKTMLDLTMRQYMALEVIAGIVEEGDGMLNSIAALLDTTKQNAKQLINALMEKGYVEQGPNKLDPRAIKISATDAGREALVREGAVQAAFLREAYANVTEAELAQFVTLLHKLYSFDGKNHESL